MVKKLLIFFLLLSLFLSGLSKPSYASFFKNLKKHRTEKKQSVQESDKKAEEKKVLVVEIYASWCPGCKNIEPTLDYLSKSNTDIEFIQLDVSTPSKAKVSEQRAKDLKITDFFNANKSKTATVAIIIPSTLEAVSVFQNNNAIEDYLASIKTAKEKEEALKNPPPTPDPPA